MEAEGARDVGLIDPGTQGIRSVVSITAQGLMAPAKPEKWTVRPPPAPSKSLGPSRAHIVLDAAVGTESRTRERNARIVSVLSRTKPGKRERGAASRTRAAQDASGRNPKLLTRKGGGFLTH